MAKSKSANDLTRIKNSSAGIREKTERAIAAVRRAAEALERMSQDADAVVVEIGTMAGSVAEEAREHYDRIVGLRDGLLGFINPGPQGGRRGRTTGQITLTKLANKIREAERVADLPDRPFAKQGMSHWTADEKRVYHARRMREAEMV